MTIHAAIPLRPQAALDPATAEGASEDGSATDLTDLELDPNPDARFAWLSADDPRSRPAGRRLLGSAYWGQTSRLLGSDLGKRSRLLGSACWGPLAGVRLLGSDLGKGSNRERIGSMGCG